MFSVSGEKLRSFGTPGSGEGELKYPCGVAVDAEGNILVADITIIAFRSSKQKASSSQPWVLRVVDLCSLIVPGALHLTLGVCD